MGWAWIQELDWYGVDCFNPKLIIYDTDVGRLLLKKEREGKKIQFMPYKFGELYLRSLLYCPHSTFPMYFGFALISIKNMLFKKKRWIVISAILVKSCLSGRCKALPKSQHFYQHCWNDKAQTSLFYFIFYLFINNKIFIEITWVGSAKCQSPHTFHI